jgi:hypothetical protein
MPSFAGRSFLTVAALFAPALAAQQAQLRVLVVAGQDALNNIRLPENRDVVVEVQDQNRRPVMGAEVTFILPDQGASGTFPNGTRTLVTTTDAQGQAFARGVRPNSQTGPMQIRVSATYLGQTATAVITQTNVTLPVAETPKPAPAKVETPPPAAAPPPAPPSPRSGMRKGGKVALALAIVGGVAAGVVFGTRESDGRNGGGGPPAIVITPGAPTVGGPQ